MPFGKKANGEAWGEALKATKWKPKPPFVLHTQALRKSSARRTRSDSCRRLLEFLEDENMRLGGFQNGKLKATHEQLYSHGICKDAIAPAIREAEARGLIETWPKEDVRIKQPDGSYKNPPTEYRLTYLPSGDNQEHWPTDDWKGRDFSAPRNRVAKGAETWVSAPENRGAKDGRKPRQRRNARKSVAHCSTPQNRGPNIER